MFTTNQQQC